MTDATNSEQAELAEWERELLALGEDLYAQGAVSGIDWSFGQADWTEGNSVNAYGRWFLPIGPAPKGWRVIKGCSRTIPHTDESEDWMNDDMNADHYREDEGSPA